MHTHAVADPATLRAARRRGPFSYRTDESRLLETLARAIQKQEVAADALAFGADDAVAVYRSAVRHTLRSRAALARYYATNGVPEGRA